ncbi:hypothetical protein LMJF_34_2515 [Leishmania major strain Friedlin]|uniref:Secreted protein n=1 Tax=Leishmania major TaxID=5664 RepID=Q4Q2U4_LEIMA|nr:hypothetical protein LMJF_34_2515 [Leishmania major strain Friedlin]CAG9582128.1 hypothetical_protein [Leishmania major strain Friedlin]CAJ07971.1 hypothetical protein LMJF_34_2515 [Leishmania major strain Friedlin]|eukprot:XP_001686354.1 hypothetical protein LMJF_34_2515 [Leishmania major strain Friedlin]
MHTIVRFYHILLSLFASHLYFPALPSSPLRASVGVCVSVKPEWLQPPLQLATALCLLPFPSRVHRLAKTRQSTVGVREGSSQQRERRRRSEGQEDAEISRRTTKNKNVEVVL